MVSLKLHKKVTGKVKFDIFIILCLLVELNGRAERLAELREPQDLIIQTFK